MSMGDEQIADARTQDLEDSTFVAFLARAPEPLVIRKVGRDVIVRWGQHPNDCRVIDADVFLAGIQKWRDEI